MRGYLPGPFGFGIGVTGVVRGHCCHPFEVVFACLGNEQTGVHAAAEEDGYPGVGVAQPREIGIQAGVRTLDQLVQALPCACRLKFDTCISGNCGRPPRIQANAVGRWNLPDLAKQRPIRHQPAMQKHLVKRIKVDRAVPDRADQGSKAEGPCPSGGRLCIVDRPASKEVRHEIGTSRGPIHENKSIAPLPWCKRADEFARCRAESRQMEL